MSHPQYKDIGIPVTLVIDECSELTQALCKADSFGELRRKLTYKALNDLITEAIQLVGTDMVSHKARLWQSKGCRSCPIGLVGCSQTVYVDLKTGEYDYGYRGGPGYADCVRHCRHGMTQQPDEEDDEILEPAANT